MNVLGSKSLFSRISVGL